MQERGRYPLQHFSITHIFASFRSHDPPPQNASPHASCPHIAPWYFRFRFGVTTHLCETTVCVGCPIFLYTYTLVNRARFAARFALAITDISSLHEFTPFDSNRQLFPQVPTRWQCDNHLAGNAGTCIASVVIILQAYSLLGERKPLSIFSGSRGLGSLCYLPAGPMINPRKIGLLKSWGNFDSNTGLNILVPYRPPSKLYRAS